MKRGNTFWREGRGDLKTGEMIRERIRNDACMIIRQYLKNV